MKRHSLDLASLVFALVFLLYASLWPLWRLDILDQHSLSWVPATALILIGLLGLTLSIARSRPTRTASDPEPWGGDETVYDDAETPAVAEDSL